MIFVMYTREEKNKRIKISYCGYSWFML